MITRSQSAPPFLWPTRLTVEKAVVPFAFVIYDANSKNYYDRSFIHSFIHSFIPSPNRMSNKKEGFSNKNIKKGIK